VADVFITCAAVALVAFSFLGDRSAEDAPAPAEA
jgi:lipoprotein signal peptidase